MASLWILILAICLLPPGREGSWVLKIAPMREGPGRQHQTKVEIKSSLCTASQKIRLGCCPFSYIREQSYNYDPLHFWGTTPSPEILCSTFY